MISEDLICGECGREMFWDNSQPGYEGWQCSNTYWHKSWKEKATGKIIYPTPIEQDGTTSRLPATVPK